MSGAICFDFNLASFFRTQNLSGWAGQRRQDDHPLPVPDERGQGECFDKEWILDDRFKHGHFKQKIAEKSYKTCKILNSEFKFKPIIFTIT